MVLSAILWSLAKRVFFINFMCFGRAGFKEAAPSGFLLQFSHEKCERFSLQSFTHLV